MKPTLSLDDIKKIVHADHHDPFHVLGMHCLETEKGGKGIVVRTFYPDAAGLTVLPENPQYPQKRMHKIHKEGLYEGVFEDTADFFSYRLKADLHNGSSVITADAYSFPPVISEYDMHLFAEGNNIKIYEKLGSHRMRIHNTEGFLFAVWAPNARRVSVVGGFNNWDGRMHPMRARGASGIWELFIPELSSGELYKYEIKAQNCDIFLKADPYGFRTELRPSTATITCDIDAYTWQDAEWMEKRVKNDILHDPLSIYEVHLGSWMRVPEEDNRNLTFREVAPRLVDYVKKMGYTHVEFLPLASHPYDPSWGYQVTGYYSPAEQYGSPEDLMYLIDALHQNGIGVILDWVPAHFPTDSHSLAWFDGTCLYEHADPRKGMHPDWGTLVFNYGRNEVRNFLISNAYFWLERYHIDGLRVDAVASMLYLDYSRKDGQWIPNEFGGRENLHAIDFMIKLNQIIHAAFPGVLMIAEESTAWPGVSRPTYLGGLGFGFKWNMGWMHDILEYVSKDPVHRKYYHNNLTFALLYTFYENFILPFSHDEVVHGKGSLMGKMPGDYWQKFANMRLLLAYMYGHPGKKHLFMGIDIGQWNEWNHNSSIEWHLLDFEPHRKLNGFVEDLNRLYRSEKALHELDFDYSGFEWIDFTDSENSILSFIRKSRQNEVLVLVYNFTPVPRYGYRIGVPFAGFYEEVLNSDSEIYGGSNMGNGGGMFADHQPWHGKGFSLNLTLPPLSCLVFKPRF